MAAEEAAPASPIDREEPGGDAEGCYLHKFRLYETQSKFYMVGRDKRKTLWKVLKIDRSEPCELNVREDSSTYSKSECHELLKRIHEGNRSTGGLRFVTSCYGIVGFIKFFGPYYMLLITKRKQVGAICGHTVYAITKSEIITLPNSAVWPDVANSKNENRYKTLLCTVDLTKDFFFSYSYHVMRSLQKNLCDGQNGQVVYDSMFVWNEFLTRGIRNRLKNTLWTVALVYGFFKQAKLSISGRDFKLTLIARRSRYYAGTRYLKRGVNDNGEVANDVETEQIVFEDVSEGHSTMISSIVQNRGSIPLFWSQETSRLNLKPDIVLHRKDQNYEATRLHFENLVKRYGNPIIILNLIKTHEKKPRESILRTEFANAIDFINKDSSEENLLRFLHWDLHKHSRSKATNVLSFLGRVAAYALNFTGFFYCQMRPSMRMDDVMKWPVVGNDDDRDWSYMNLNHNGADNSSGDRPREDTCSYDENYFSKPPMFQKGVLRTNCIDCLDRTNVAQYSYGLAALGHQLHALGLIDVPNIDVDTLLADELMSFYETMGDTLAMQYGGSAAHNKIFCERRGQWKATIQSQEFFRTLQRYYNNAYTDAEKQDAINVFLGNFQPQQDVSSLWELDDNVGRGYSYADVYSRSFFERSLSDGNIGCKCYTPVLSTNNRQKKLIHSALSKGGAKGLSDSTPEISTCERDNISYSRYSPSIACRRLFTDNEHFCLNGNGNDASNCSNFLDLDCPSSSGNSCEEEIYDRSSLINSPSENISTENVINGTAAAEATPTPRENGPSISEGQDSTVTALPVGASQNLDELTEFSDSFVRWVVHGETLCY